ncbi:hypothetical protein C3L33_05712, partial [Rhododendron williamsianum]
MDLVVRNNNLSTLPDGICNLTRLTLLDLAKNNVSNLPSGIGRLTSLQRLFLGRNSLCTLPDTIGKLSGLRKLILKGNNGLRALPESIFKLVHLYELDLSDCNFSHLPSEIGDLVYLEVLDLGNNGFRSLPESICKIHRLEDLDLNNCNLSHLPKLPTRTWVEAKCCPSLESLPLELDQLGCIANYSGSSKLAENNYLTSLLKQLPKSK